MGDKDDKFVFEKVQLHCPPLEEVAKGFFKFHLIVFKFYNTVTVVCTVILFFSISSRKSKHGKTVCVSV